MVKGIIFDMDGVLVDNRDVHIEAFGILCRRYGAEFDADDLILLFGRGNDEIIPSMLPAEVVCRVGLEKLADEKEEIYRQIYADSIKPVRGLVEFLDDVRSHGLKCAVGSSGPMENVSFVLEKCGIAGSFDAIADGSMVSKRKPDPEIFLKAAGLLGLEPEECVVIEDSFAGIEAAKRGGMRVVAMATTFPRHALAATHSGMIVSDFTELSYADILSM